MDYSAALGDILSMKPKYIISNEWTIILHHFWIEYDK